MRFGVITAARLDYVDRAPISKAEATLLVAAVPHGLTTRLSYTVPAAHKYLLESTYAQIMRITAGAPVGLAEIRFQGQTAAPQFFYVPYLQSLDNVAGAINRIQGPGTILLLAGESLQGADSDASTGGTVSFTYSYKGIEFDA